MVGILALMIPLLAILVYSPVGRSIAYAIQSGASGAAGASEAELDALRLRVADLEARLNEQDIQVQQLQENSEFYKQLLESSEALKRLQSKES